MLAKKQSVRRRTSKQLTEGSRPTPILQATPPLVPWPAHSGPARGGGFVADQLAEPPTQMIFGAILDTFAVFHRGVDGLVEPLTCHRKTIGVRR